MKPGNKASKKALVLQLLELALLSQMLYFDDHFLHFPLMKAGYLPIVTLHYRSTLLNSLI